MAIQIHAADPARMEQALQVIETANPHLHDRLGRFRASGARWHDAVPMVCEVDGIIASTAVIFRRAVCTPSGPALFGGVGAVATIPGMRRRGLAGALLRKCEQLMESEGYEVAVLFCTITSLYEHLGWKVVEERDISFVASTDMPRLEFRRINPNVVPEEIIKLYETSGTGALIRNVGIWHEYAAWVREDDDLFWAAFDKDYLLAYARARRSDDGIQIVEATCAHSQEGVLSALYRKQLSLASTSRFISPSSTMMIKPLSPVRRGNQRMLKATDFENGVPWNSRTWWVIDRF